MHRHRLLDLGIGSHVSTSLTEFYEIIKEMEENPETSESKFPSAIILDMHMEGVNDLGSVGSPQIHTNDGASVGLAFLQEILAPKIANGSLPRIPIAIASAYNMAEVEIEKLRRSDDKLYSDLFLFNKAEASSLDDQAFAAFVKKSHKLYDQDVADEPDSELFTHAQTKLITASQTLLEALQKKPDIIDSITPRQFEEIVGELLDDQGWTVQLTPMTRDGGADIMAYLGTELGPLLCLVDAKKYRRDRQIRVGMVRELFGTLTHFEASSAMMVTTSSFSRDAIEFRNDHEYRLSLRDFRDVSRWIEKYSK